MKTLLALCVCMGVATAFDCFRRNNSCARSHITCDTGYEPFCEHLPGPFGRRIGICTCDKECSAASDCTNVGADGCPPMSHPTCDTTLKVCHCFAPPSPPAHFERNDSS